MSTSVGTAYVSIKPTTKGIGADIENQLRSETKGTGVIGHAMGTALGMGMLQGATAGLRKLSGMLKNSVMEGANLEQQLGGSKAVFEKYSSELVKMSKTAFSEMGLSQNQYLQGANKMGSLFQGAGHTVRDSMTMSMDYMKRASDVASIMGIDTQDALDAVTAAAKGNFTMMDNLGVAMNATTLEAYALSKGINKSWNSMTNQEKTGLAYQMFMDKTSKYAGNYAKENETLAGSLNTVKKGFETLMGQLAQGEDISQTLENLKEPMKNFANAVVTSIKNIAPQISVVMKEFAPIISQGISELAPVLIPAFIEILGQIASGIIQALPSIMAGVGNAFMNLDLGAQLGIGILVGFKAFGLGSKLLPMVTSALGVLKTVKIPPIPAGGGAGFGGFMMSLANGLKAFGNPAILKGAAILSAAMVILSGATWVSVQIIADALPKLGASLTSFNTIDGVNLLAVGGGLLALAGGLVAITAGSIIDGLARFVGAGFDKALKGIIEPIATLMPTITPETINKFHLLGTGLLALGNGFNSVKGFVNGGKVAASITSINNAVVAAAPSAGVYPALSAGLTSLSVGLKEFMNIKLNAGNVTTFLTQISQKINSLNNFNWGGAISKLKTQASRLGTSIGQGVQQGVNQFNWGSLTSTTQSKAEKLGDGVTKGISNSIKNFGWSGLASMVGTEGNSIGLAVCQGITAGVNNNAYMFINAIRAKIREMVSAAKAEADINSPSKVFEKEVGYWIGAGTATGVPKGIDDYMPKSINHMRSYVSSLDVGGSSSQSTLPSEFKIIDGDGFIARLKPVIEEKIIRNNVNLKHV